MSMKMKREFVHVIQGIESNETIMILSKIEGCAVTEHAGTVTVATHTMGGLAALIDLCKINQGEKKINTAFRSVEEAIVNFID